MFATLYLPNFSLQAAMRHQPALSRQPVALIEEQENRPVVIQLNEAAASVGIEKGMTPSQALARCLQVVIRVRERAQEKLIDDILLQHAFMLSPFVEATAPGICTIQFTDNRNLTAKLARVVEKLAQCEITAQAGVAPRPDTSLIAAHVARPICEVNEAKEFLAPLAIETLALA